MMTLEEMQELLKDTIPGKRYKHSEIGRAHV